jgi:hypothetical protein
LKIGAITEDNGKFIDNLKGVTRPSDSTLKKQAAFNYSLVSLEEPGSTASNMNGSVTRDGLKDLFDAEREYRLNVERIMELKKGDIVVVASVISGRVSFCSEGASDED